MLDALNGTATTSDSDTFSIDAIRKKEPSLSWRVEDEVESSEVDMNLYHNFSICHQKLLTDHACGIFTRIKWLIILVMGHGLEKEAKC